MQSVQRILLATFLVLSLWVQAQPKEEKAATPSEKGIEFFHGSLDEALDLARTQKKLVFIDAFTDWCGPCKMMAATTFLDEKVADFFNENFVNVKIDMEKGEGPDVANKYKVNAYPTLLFLNSKGSLLHTIVGFRKAPEFLEEARTAVNPKNNTAALEDEYDEGSRDPELLYNYAERLLEQQKTGADKVAREYFLTQKDEDLTSERNWKAYQKFVKSLNSREFEYLISHKADFAKKYGMFRVDELISNVCNYNLIHALTSENEELYQKVVDIARKNLNDKGKAADAFEVQYAAAKDDWKLYAEKVVNYMAKHKESADAQSLNEYAWNFYEKVEDKALLEKALGWAKQSIAIANSYYNNDTYAALLFKLNRYEEALRYANKAIRIAQETNAEYADTEALIEKIEQARNR